MNRLFTLLSALILSATTLSAVNPYSHLGHWVKIGTAETGIYEISYEALRELGFTNPENVGVFGRGGRPLDENLTDKDGADNGNTNFPRIACLHLNDKLYFYALGVEWIDFEKDEAYSLGGSYKRKNRNIYSTHGIYFLSDAIAPLNLSEPAYDLLTEPLTPIECLDYRYLEEDLVHNTQTSGQLYWSDVFNRANPSRTYTLGFDGGIAGSLAVVEVEFHYSDSENGKAAVSFGGSENITKTIPAVQTYNFIPLPNFCGELMLPSPNPSLQLDYTAPRSASQGMLDWWLVTFKKVIPSAPMAAQTRFQLFNAPTDVALKLPIARPDIEIWDVTNAVQPLRGVNFYEEDGLRFLNNSPMPTFAMFDPNEVQKEVAVLGSVTFPDLDKRAAEGADLLIITTDALQDYAEQLAQLHRSRDGIKVLTATVADIYNEYSAGLPDPMAYKYLIKKLYDNQETPLQNVLLFGPMTSDLRGCIEPHDPAEWIIAYQNTNVSRTAGASNPNDFYAMLDNYSEASLWHRPIQVGLGVLPVASDLEASLAVKKIERFLDDNDFAFRANSLLFMSSPGDNHMSDEAVIETEQYLMDLMGNTAVSTMVIPDAYKNIAEGRNRWMNAIKSGNLLNVYCGHGDPTAMAASYKLLYPADLTYMVNPHLPFSFFAGCSLTNFDRGVSGIGEQMILGVRDGLIGAILASRETYSNENLVIAKSFYDAMFMDAEGNRRTQTPTIGEIYAAGKSALSLQNKFAFHLMCDPALRIPLPYLTMKRDSEDALAGQAGRSITLEGEITDREGESALFDGKLVAKIISSPQTLRSGNLQAHDQLYPLDVKYDGNPLSIATGTVKEGKFSLSLYLPIALEKEDKPTVALCAYDEAQRLSAIARFPLSVAEADASATDSQSPVITHLFFDDSNSRLEIKATDNRALQLAETPFVEGLKVYVDGMSQTSSARLRGFDVAANEAFWDLSLTGLSAGPHEVQVIVKDDAGNDAHGNLSINIGEGTCAPTLGFAKTPTREKAVFSLSLSPSELVVVAPNGETIHVIDAIGHTLEWDYTNAGGERVAPGLYKVFLRDTSALGRVGCSEVLYLPVLQQL